MIYTILYAENDRHVVSLDKRGNMYQVAVWSKTAHFTVESADFETFHTADHVFRKRVKDYWCGDIHEAHPEPFCVANID